MLKFRCPKIYNNLIVAVVLEGDDIVLVDYDTRGLWFPFIINEYGDKLPNDLTETFENVCF